MCYFIFKFITFIFETFNRYNKRIINDNINRIVDRIIYNY